MTSGHHKIYDQSMQQIAHAICLDIEEGKRQKVLSEAEFQASSISFHIDVLSQECKQIKSAMQMMNDEFVKCMKLAEQK